MNLLDNVTNNASSTLNGAINDSVTALAVKAGEGALFPTGTFNLVVRDANGANYEICRCTSRSTDTFTIVRAQEGTTAVSHADGSIVELPITAKMITDIDTGFSKVIPASNIFKHQNFR